MKRLATVLLVAMMSAGCLAVSGCVIAPPHGGHHAGHAHRSAAPGHWDRNRHDRHDRHRSRRQWH